MSILVVDFSYLDDFIGSEGGHIIIANEKEKVQRVFYCYTHAQSLRLHGCEMWTF